MWLEQAVSRLLVVRTLDTQQVAGRECTRLDLKSEAFGSGREPQGTDAARSRSPGAEGGKEPTAPCTVDWGTDCDDSMAARCLPQPTLLLWQ